MCTSCNRYFSNRYFDLRDVADFAVGVTHEKPSHGIIPPALGVYVEVTDLLHLGAMSYNGTTAELDMRGSGVYREDRKRLGLLWWQAYYDDQQYDEARYKNYFKTEDTLWADWMRSPLTYSYMLDAPAKTLTYDHWNDDMQYGTFMLRRGKQYWEYTGAEVAICDPFFTHWGLMLRTGFDISELSDFLLGWFTLDYKRDDLTEQMYNEMLGMRDMQAMQPAADHPTTTEAPVAIEVTEQPMTETTPQGESLAERNRQLQEELGKLQARVRQLESGLEIKLPDKVLFYSGCADLTAAGKATLDELAAKLKAHYPNHQILIEGHTDSVPVDKTKKAWKSNWELGSARSLAVLHYLADKAGLDDQNFGAVTYGANRPDADNANAEGRRQNRRAQVVLRPVNP